MWKIGNKATAADDAYLVDLRTGKVGARVLQKLKEYDVQDVIKFKCMYFLDVGVSDQGKKNVTYQCPQCKEMHVVNKGESSNIFFPEIWFVKAEEEGVFRRIKRKIKNNVSEKGDKHLYTYPKVDKPVKTSGPQKKEEVECNKMNT